MFIPILRSAVSLQLTEFWLVFLNDSTNCVNFLCSVLTEANFDHRCAAF